MAQGNGGTAGKGNGGNSGDPGPMDPLARFAPRTPYDDSLPLVHDYQQDMRFVGLTDYSYMGLEGYLNAVVLVDGLRRAGRDVTEDSLIDSLEHLTIDLRSLAIHFASDTRQGTHKVFLTKVDHGRAVPIKKLDPADYAK